MTADLHWESLNEETAQEIDKSPDWQAQQLFFTVHYDPAEATRNDNISLEARAQKVEGGI